jgi:hypothetical protein
MTRSHSSGHQRGETSSDEQSLRKLLRRKAVWKTRAADYEPGCIT